MSAFIIPRDVLLPPRSNPDHRDGIVSDVKWILKQEQAASLIPAAFLAFGLLDAVPIPTDAGYFWGQKWLDDHRDQLSEHKFWILSYLNYYGWDVAWYMGLFALTYFTGRTVGQKAMIGLGVVSLGAIVGEILNFSRDHHEKRLANPAGHRRIDMSRAYRRRPALPGCV
jgi:hypothetical protein